MAISEEQKQFFSQNFTIPCRIMHPKLLTAVSRPAAPGQAQKAPQYGVMAVWSKSDPKAAQVTANLKQFLDAAFAKYHSGIDKRVLIDPLKDYDTYLRTDGKPNPDYTQGCHWVNANSGEKFAPVVVDKMQQPVIMESLIYSGMNALVNISFYNMDGATGGKRGIGVNINAVMLQDGGDRVVSQHTPDINQIFGGFQADMGMAQQPVQAQPMQQQPVQQPQYQQPVQQPMQQPLNQPFQQPVQQPVQQEQTVANPFAPQGNNPYV